MRHNTFTSADLIRLGKAWGASDAEAEELGAQLADYVVAVVELVKARERDEQGDSLNT